LGNGKVTDRAVCPRLPEHFQCFEWIPRLHSRTDTRPEPLRHVLWDFCRKLGRADGASSLATDPRFCNHFGTGGTEVQPNNASTFAIAPPA
jgi:hypothetical protein